MRSLRQGLKNEDVINVMDENNAAAPIEYEAVVVGVIDLVILNTEYEADIINAVMHDKNEEVINVMDENNAAAPIEELQLYYYQYSTSKGRC
jgi:hypothetical protein